MIQFDWTEPEDLESILSVVDVMSPATIDSFLEWAEGDKDSYTGMSLKEVTDAISKYPYPS